MTALFKSLMTPPLATQTVQLLGVIRGVDFINYFVLYAYLSHLRPNFYTTISLSNVGLKAWIVLHRVQTVFEIDPRWRPAKKILWHETIFLNFSMSGRVSQQVFFCFVLFFSKSVLKLQGVIWLPKNPTHWSDYFFLPPCHSHICTCVTMDKFNWEKHGSQLQTLSRIIYYWKVIILLWHKEDF